MSSAVWAGDGFSMVGRLLRFVLVVLLACVAAAAVAIWYVQDTRLSARAQPGALETAIATRLRHFAVPSTQRLRSNPVRPTADVIEAGMEHFADHCATCHANDGSGDTMFGRALYPRPPDLRQARTQRLTDGELFAIIQNGVRFTGMPGFATGDPRDDNDSWKLVCFIRHLPVISPQELAKMKRLNPQSPAEREDEQEIEDFLNGGTPHVHQGHGR